MLHYHSFGSVLLYKNDVSQIPAHAVATPGRSANCGFVNLGLFPISERHKLIQNFLQSLEPSFLVGGCPSISPVHMRGGSLH
jgi:hypothetical protein